MCRCLDLLVVTKFLPLPKGSPAPAGNTVEWLTEFFAACDRRSDCIRPTFITMHAYMTSVQSLKDYVVSISDDSSATPHAGRAIRLHLLCQTSVHKAFSLPIWLTEFTCHSFGGQPQPTTQQQVHDFMGSSASSGL